MKGIIAVNNIGFIGQGNEMLWHNSEDLKHFQKLTMNSKCVVGRRTFDYLPTLIGRELLIFDGDFKSQHLDAEWCIGGRFTYEFFCSHFTELHVSHIDNDEIGDVTFPDFTNLNPTCKIFNYHF